MGDAASLLVQHGFAQALPGGLAAMPPASPGAAGAWERWRDRAFLLDSESLAEGGVIEFLTSIGHFLEGEGVTVAGASQHFAVGGGYLAQVDGEDYLIYEADEVDSDLLWEQSAQRALGMVNHLLREAGSAKSAYLVGGGNDGLAVFLTPEMYEEVREAELTRGIPENYRARPVTARPPLQPTPATG
ncbi:MAG TPA: hypothetical protein VNT60_00050 [Deinococcales bacterium]|nr:hypothetical protein [Deinococcales bacterium]